MHIDGDTLDDRPTRLLAHPSAPEPQEAAQPRHLSPRETVVEQRGHLALPCGSRVSEFEIRALIGQGGFGIVYRAHDLSLQREVAIKEYMPSSLAMREADGQGVTPCSESHASAFGAGLKSFINEARLLAYFDHPALVKVHRFWEANGSAYMAMPLYAGPTLHSELRRRGPGMQEADILAWLLPLLDALETLHAAKCYHRDIAPDNILLTANGPLLLDFGAARRVIGDMTRVMTVVLKPGYAPIEQYGDGEGDTSSSSQGPWTDLYALACVVRYAVTGHAPVPAVERVLSDGLRPLSSFAGDLYSQGFQRAIDSAMALRPQDRPQSVAAFRAVLTCDTPRMVATEVDLELAIDSPATHVRESSTEAQAQRRAAATPPSSDPARRFDAASMLPTPRNRRAHLRVLLIGGALLAGLALIQTWSMRGTTPASSDAATVPPRPSPFMPMTPAAEVAQPLPFALKPTLPSASASTPPGATHAIVPRPSTQRDESRVKRSVSSARQVRALSARVVENPEPPLGRAVTVDDGRCAELLERASFGNPLPGDAAQVGQHCK